MTNKRRAKITSVDITKGVVVCNADDMDSADKDYRNIPFQRPATGQITVPPVQSVVVVEKMFDGSEIVTGILSTPQTADTDTQNLIDQANNDAESTMLVYGRRDRNGPVEKIAVEATDTGYEITADVQGDVTLSAGGNIVIEQGGTAKRVLTEDAQFEYEDTGDTSGGGAGTTTKTTTTVSNGEKTDVKID
jgi:hypothetical protein